jgi:hypothetical protein
MSIGRSGAAVLLLWAIVESGTPAPTLYGREPASGTCLTGPALAAGRLKRCERELQRYLDDREDNADAWFELGFVRCLATGMIHGRSDELGFELWR